MAASNEQLNILVRVAADEASARKAAAAIDIVSKELDKTKKRSVDVEKAAAEMNAELAQIARNKAISLLSQDMESAVREGLDLREALEYAAQSLSAIGASEDEIRAVARALGEAASESQRIQAPEMPTPQLGGGAVGGTDINQLRREGVGDLSTTAGALSSVLGGNELAGAIGDITGFIEYLPTVGQSIAALGPAGLATVAASVAVVAIGGQVADMYDKQAQSARRLINTQEEYYTAVETLTADELDARIEEQRQAVEIQRQIYNELNSVVETGYQQTSNTLGVFTDTFLQITNAGGARELREARDAELQALEEQEFLLGRLESARGSEAIATNTSAEAAEAAAAAERELAQARDNNLISFVQLQIQADQMTAEQRAERIAQIQRELVAYQAAVDGGQLTAEGLTQVERTMYNLNTEMSVLQYTFESSADVAAEAEAATKAATEAEQQLSQIRQKNASRDAEKVAAATTRVTAAQDALTAIFEQQFDAANAVSTANANLTATWQTYQKAITDGEAKIAELEATAADKELDLRIKTDQELEKLQTDAGKDRVKAEQDLGKAIRQAQNQYLRDYGRAVANRDVDAAIRAKETFAEQQSSATEAYNEQIATIDENLKEQQAVLEDRYREQLATIKRESERQIAETKAAVQRETDAKRQAYMQAKTDLQNAQYAEDMLRKQFLRSQAALQQQEQSARLIAQQTAGQQSVQLASQYGYAAGQAAASEFYKGATSGKSLGGLGSMATGGQAFPPLNAIPTSYTQTAGRAANTNITVYSGSDTQTIRGISNSEASLLLRQVLVD